ncbi:MAG: hypothetical protein MJZ31_06980 [Bacteroidales bacterium]|nr:hypothetical protein [Bacteroidales bacterium]
MAQISDDKTKQYRQQLIKELIQSKTIRSQDDLLELLKEQSITTTQATLSRDLRELKVAKVTDSDGYKYVLSHNTTGAHPLRNPSASSIVPGSLTIEMSGQMCVLHTMPGYAGAVAATLDAMQLRGVMGTLAGDDTILMILRSDADKSYILTGLRATFPEIVMINNI